MDAWRNMTRVRAPLTERPLNSDAREFEVASKVVPGESLEGAGSGVSLNDTTQASAVSGSLSSLSLKQRYTSCEGGAIPTCTKVNLPTGGRVAIHTAGLAKSTSLRGYNTSCVLSHRASKVILCGVDSRVSLANVVSQVRGGPLSSIERGPDGVVLRFSKEGSARIFYEYAMSGRFVVAGTNTFPGTRLLSEPNNQSLRWPHGFRRCLELHCEFSYDLCDRDFSCSEIADLKQVFGVAGTVLSVKPMLTRDKKAFFIEFASIESAICARKLFHESREHFFSKHMYCTLEFSRDVTEGSCL